MTANEGQRRSMIAYEGHAGPRQTTQGHDRQCRATTAKANVGPQKPTYRGGGLEMPGMFFFLFSFAYILLSKDYLQIYLVPTNDMLVTSPSHTGHYNTMVHNHHHHGQCGSAFTALSITMTKIFYDLDSNVAF